MTDNDWDIVHSYNSHREYMRDLAETEDCGQSDRFFQLQTKVGAIKLFADFVVDHDTDNVTVTTYTTSSPDTVRQYSVQAARKLYATLIKRGYKLVS